MLKVSQGVVQINSFLNCMSSSELVSSLFLPVPVSGMHVMCCRECLPLLSTSCQGLRLLAEGELSQRICELVPASAADAALPLEAVPLRGGQGVCWPGPGCRVLLH